MNAYGFGPLGHALAFAEGGYGPLVAIVVVLVGAWLLWLLRRFLVSILAVVSAGCIALLGVWATLFWAIVRALARRLVPMRLIVRGAHWLVETVGRVSSNVLVRGDRRATAEAMWPPAHFSFLYCDVPADIRRPLFEDGKLIGGIRVAWMADRHVTAALLDSAVTGAVLATLVAFVPPVLLYLATFLWSVFSPILDTLLAARPVIEQWPDGAPVLVDAGSWYVFVLDYARTPLKWLVTDGMLPVLRCLLIALGIALIVGPAIIYVWRAAQAAPYQRPTKDADVRWAFRAETREILNTTYNQQVALAVDYLRDSPLFKVGEATGSLRLRGDLSAPTTGQAICIDQDSLFQHVLVLGGTGEGKTSGVLRPLMRQLLPMRHYGMYVCDAKGVLWRDAEAIANDVGRASDVVVIGTGTGQRGVDPIAELSPTQVVAVLRSVLRQIGGATSESFWPDMAATVLRHVFTVARSYAQTAAGAAESERGVNPYSLWWVYQATLDEKIINAALQHIVDDELRLKALMESAGSEEERQEVEAKIDTLLPSELRSSVIYLLGPWKNMASDTRSGIVANVTQLLDGFSGTQVLRERFACGQPGGAVRLSEALDGKIVLNALSSIEDGLPARLVIMLLKTTLYREARRRETAWKAETPPRSPQAAPCIVVMDEVQEIATSDPTSGLSDATFWNVARSTGLAGIFATQTVAALEQAMGAEAAANFLQQARSKVFFRSEDQATVEYACWCAGEFERDRVFDDGLYESIEFRDLLTKRNLFAPVDETLVPLVGPRFFFRVAGHLVRGRGLDWHLPSRSAFGNSKTSFGSTRHMTEQAWNREEDLEWRYRTEGTSVMPALTPADLLSMGRWHAYAHIQRAGAVRQDLMVVRHEHG